METVIQKMQQFLVDEKELLSDLALDVADAEKDYEYAKSKAIYSIQMARVSGIKDTLAMLEQSNK